MRNMTSVENPDGTVTVTHVNPTTDYTDPSLYPMLSTRLVAGSRIQIKMPSTAPEMAHLQVGQIFANPSSVVLTAENYPTSFLAFSSTGLYFTSSYSGFQGPATAYVPAAGSGSSGVSATHPQATMSGGLTYIFELSSDGKLLYSSSSDINGVFTDQYNLITDNDADYVYVSAIVLPSGEFLSTPGAELSIEVSATSTGGDAHAASNPYLNFPNGIWKFYDNALVLDVSNLSTPSIIAKPGAVFGGVNVNSSAANLPNCYAPVGKLSNGDFGSYEYTFRIPSVINQGRNKVVCAIAEVPYDSGITFPVNYVNSIKTEFKAGVGGVYSWSLTGITPTFPTIDWIRVESYGGIGRIALGTDADGELAHIDVTLVDIEGARPVVSLAGLLLGPVGYTVSTEGTDFIVPVPPESDGVWESTSSDVVEIALGDPVFSTAGQLTYNGVIPTPASDRDYSSIHLAQGMVIEIDISQMADAVQNAEMWIVPDDFGGFDANDFPVKSYGGIKILPTDPLLDPLQWNIRDGIGSFSGTANDVPVFESAPYWNDSTIANVSTGIPAPRLFIYRDASDEIIYGVIDITGKQLYSGSPYIDLTNPDLSTIKLVLRTADTEQSLLYFISTLSEVDLPESNPGSVYLNASPDQFDGGAWAGYTGLYYGRYNMTGGSLPFYSDGTVTTGKFGGMYASNNALYSFSTQVFSDVSAFGQMSIIYGPVLPPVDQHMSAESLAGAFGIIFRPDVGVGSVWSGAIRPFYVTYDSNGVEQTAQRIADGVSDLSLCCAAIHTTADGFKFAIIDSDKALWEQGYQAALIEEFPTTPIRIMQYRPAAFTVAIFNNVDVETTDVISYTQSYFYN